MKNLFALLEDYIEALDIFEDMWNNDQSATTVMLKDEMEKVKIAEQNVKQYIVDNETLYQLDF